ncbi:hypothetical protein [Halioxenophilus sp. WMMB6]|uniref:hypothetical protein n=1 Tax=Halioxenophilus sp. WMMB6 TaxID=3073815 RepID=UPI00295EF797|nr:hypothetical protein [Halioxenophilus sp. WMMB6]
MIILNWAVYFGWLVVVVYAGFQFIINAGEVRYRALLLLVPVTSIIVFSIVFVVNRGSSVAQLSESTDLWSFWFHWYFPLSIGSIVNLVASSVLGATALVKKQHRKILIFNVAVFTATVLGIYHVLPNMPDA